MRRVIDKRIKEKFMVDDIYLNGYSKLCGIHATGVYMVLCRHASKEQECFPSKKLVSEKLAISERTVYTALRKLKEFNIIEIKQQGRKADGSYINTIYILQDKSTWTPQATGAVGKRRHSPQATDDISRRQEVPNKETNREGNTYKDTEQSSAEFSLKEEIKKLENNARRDMNIIALYLEEKKPDLRNKEQFQVALKRHLRPAKQLIPFTDNQILSGVRKARNQTPEWTIETIIKMLIK